MAHVVLRPDRFALVDYDPERIKAAIRRMKEIAAGQTLGLSFRPSIGGSGWTFQEGKLYFVLSEG